MDSKVKISVIIPAYNVEPYIAQCMESVMNQTLWEIEIIVTDDGSTDATLAQIEAAAGRDTRIRIVRHETNQGTHKARKDAVSLSRGAYLMFVDGDDWLEPDACERLYAKMQETGVDILHFGTFVENCARYPKEKIAGIEKSVAPYLGPPLMKPLLVEALCERRFENYPCIKIYRGNLMRAVFAEMDDGYYTYFDDFYLTFCLLLRAQSYLGTEERFYHYGYGRGISGLARYEVSLDAFRKYCGCADVWYAIQRRLLKMEEQARDEENRNVLLEGARQTVAFLKIRFAKGLFYDVQHRIKPEDRAEALQMIQTALKLDDLAFADLCAECGFEMDMNLS